MSKVYTDSIEKRTGGAAITVPASGQWIDLASAAQGDVQYHNGTSYVRLAPGTSGQVLQTQGAGANPVWAADAGGLFSSYALIVDSKAEGVDGGTFTLGAWRTRDLNTEVTDPDGIVSIATNAFTLAAGSYLIKWVCPVFGVARHKSRLYDVTGTASIQNGMAVYAAADSCGAARVTPSGSNVYRIEHWCQTTYASIGFGPPLGTGTGVEVYAQVEIFKEA